jgi:hypothetical protein
MNFRRWAILAGVLAIASVALHQARSAGQQEKSAATASGKADDFAVRYAKVQLRVAELKLLKAQEMNRRVAETLSKDVVQLFADDVAVAKGALAAAERGGSGGGSTYNLWMRRAEQELAWRQDRMKRATEANRRVPDAYGPLDLDRMNTAIELAQLRVERGKSLANGSAEARLDWQLEMISEGLNRVDEMVTLAIQNRLADFF